MKRLRDKAIAAYEPYVRGHPSSYSIDERRDDNDEDDDDQDVRVLGGKTHIAQLPMSNHLKARLKEAERLTKSPVPMPTTTHLDNVHPLLLQYVEQSQWVSSNPSEQETYFTEQPRPSTVPYVDAHPSYYPSDLQMTTLKQEPGSIHQAPVQYTEYQSYPEPSAYQQTADMTYWTNGNEATNLQLMQEQQQQYHYTDPSLECYTDMDQYAAWQTHMKHLGLPY